MSLRFLADHCISRSIIQSLENEGHTVYRLKDHIPADSPDKEVILKAQGLDTILISLDGDFADIVRYPPDYYKGIFALNYEIIQKSFPSFLRGLTR